MGEEAAKATAVEAARAGAAAASKRLATPEVQEAGAKAITVKREAAQAPFVLRRRAMLGGCGRTTRREGHQSTRGRTH